MGSNSPLGNTPKKKNWETIGSSLEEYLYCFSDDDESDRKKRFDNNVTTTATTTTTKTRTGAPSDSRGCYSTASNKFVVDVAKMGNNEEGEEDVIVTDSENENNNKKLDKAERKSLVEDREPLQQNEEDDVDVGCKNQPMPNINKAVIIYNNGTKQEKDENKPLVQIKQKMKNEESEGGKKTCPSSSTAKMTPYFVCLVLASTCGFLVTGYQMAVVSGLLLLNKDIPVTTFWRQTLVGIVSAMAMATTVTCGQLCDKIGRRYMVILSAVIAVLAASVETSGLYHTLPGRILAGMSIGLSTLSVPIYLAENTTLSMRGPIMMLNMAALTFGQLLSGIAAAAFYYVHNNGWRFLSGIIIIPSTLQIVGFLFLPESSRFLAKNGQLAKAQKVMNSLWKDLPEKEFESMISDRNENKEHKKTSSFQIFLNIIRTPSVRRALFLGCSLHIINQMSGINIIIFYSGMVVKMAGVYDDRVAIWLSTIPTMINFLGTFVGFYLVERIGRRLLLLTSTAGVVGSLVILSLTFWQIEVQSPPVSFVEPSANVTPCGMYRTCSKCVSDPSCGFCYQQHPITGPANGSCLPAFEKTNSYSKLGRCNVSFLGNSRPFRLKWESDFCPSNLTYFIMAGQVLYLIFFASGLGSLPWTICSEIYPMWSRGICNSISSGVMWLFSWLITGTFLTLIQHLTTYGTFLLMACVTLIGWEFWFLCLPETKGKSLEETELLFTKPFFTNKKLKTQTNEEPVFV